MSHITGVTLPLITSIDYLFHSYTCLASHSFEFINKRTKTHPSAELEYLIVQHDNYATFVSGQRSHC